MSALGTILRYRARAARNRLAQLRDESMLKTVVIMAAGGGLWAGLFAGSLRAFAFLDQYPDAKVMGVTATPERLDGKGLGRHAHGFFDELVYGPSVQNLMDRGFLSKVAVFAPSMVDVSGVSLEDTPPELVTYPTGVAVNGEGELIVISYDNAHAFVSLDLPGGAFIDNGLNDLNVNSGNHGMAVAADTIWFTRANNSNGALRAITQNMSTPPSTAGPFPPQ